MGDPAGARIEIRRARAAALVAAMALIAALLLALGLGGPLGGAATATTTTTAKAGKTCGTYSSTSYYKRAKVTRVKGISCSKAMRTAKRYDRSGRQTSPLRCSLAHGGGRRLFSCENPGAGSGSLVAIGRGGRQG